MNVLILSPHGDILDEAIVKAGGVPFNRSATLEVSDWPRCAEWVVSFGYRKIIPKHIIEQYRGRIINIHMSMLPWNRGAHPNFWAWFDDTPHGVSIHRISEDLDKGEILAQRKVSYLDFRYGRDDATLRSTYEDLIVAAVGLFDRSWPKIVDGSITPYRGGDFTGSYHSSIQIDRFRRFLGYPGLADIWNTKVADVVDLGALYRDEQQ